MMGTGRLGYCADAEEAKGIGNASTANRTKRTILKPPGLASLRASDARRVGKMGCRVKSQRRRDVRRRRTETRRARHEACRPRAFRAAASRSRADAAVALPARV